MGYFTKMNLVGGAFFLAVSTFGLQMANAQTDTNASNATISSPSTGFSIFNPGAVSILPAPFNSISVTTGLTTGVGAASASGNSTTGASTSGTAAAGTGASQAALIKTTSFTTNAALSVPKQGPTGSFQAAPAFTGASSLTKAPGSPSTGGSGSSSSSGSGGPHPLFEASPF